jgi:hypothetical protein
VRRSFHSLVAAVAAVTGMSALVSCGDGATHPTPSTNDRASTAHAVRATRVSAVATPSGFGGMRVTFEHSLICDNGELIAQYAQRYGITTIYVPVSGDDVASLENRNPTTIKNLQAMTSVAAVYFVTGSTAWIATPMTLPPDVPALARIAAANPRVAGVLYDIDPEASGNWTNNPQSVLVNYFALLGTLQSAAGASSFKTALFLAHPDFATIVYAGAPHPNTTVLAQLQATSGYGGAVMLVPGSSESAQYANLEPALSALTKPFTIEASTSKYGPNTYYGQSASYLSRNLSQLASAVSSVNANVTGVEVNGWNDLYNGLQTILPQPAVYNGTLASGPLVPASGTTYLGAYVDPNGTGQSSAGTAAFETQIGRKLAFDMHFYGWTQTFPGAAESDDVANGRTPLIAWNCGDSDANVANGDDDAKIVRRAQAIKAFGSPIYIRWFWEMNLDDTNNAPRTQCYDANTDLPDGYFAPLQYIRAWAHIRSVFAAQGVTNVVWLWCVANAHGGPSQYYPGDDQVDWVGMDDYDTNDVSLHDTFFILANELSQFQEKPFMVTETGAHPGVQADYFTGALYQLKTNYPWVRALGYLDSAGTHQNWVLDSAGLEQFTKFARSSYMSAVPPAGLGSSGT